MIFSKIVLLFGNRVAIIKTETIMRIVINKKTAISDMNSPGAGRNRPYPKRNQRSLHKSEK